MRRRAFALLCAGLALGGCVGVQRPGGFGTGSAYRNSVQGQGGFAAPAGQRVAILLPLSGANAGAAQALQKAAQLALDQPGAPPLDAIDTGGTPEGAAAAARQAIARGAGIILGPLTAAETAAAGPVARAAGVGMLAFTNDATQAQPGVWTLGITPAQQTRRLAVAAQAQGRTRLAALVPDTPYGQAMGDGLVQSAAALGLPEPVVRRYSGSLSQINPVVRDLSDYADRRGPLDAQIRAARARGDAEGKREAADLVRRSIPPAPFDALLLADPGDRLEELLSLLPYYDLDPPQVKLLGPNAWGASGARLGGLRGLSGAWFAAPDPDARSGFVARYSEKNGEAPPLLADLAFDAAAIARVTARDGGWSSQSLTRADGFAGTDGVLALLPDGTVRRGLAIFELRRGGPQLVEPAPSGPPPAGA